MENMGLIIAILCIDRERHSLGKGNPESIKFFAFRFVCS